MSSSALPNRSLLLPTAQAAPRALLPDDPGVALALASTLLADGRLMFNHHRGLWGYTGIAADGKPLLIQATGVGAISATLVLRQLAALGVHTVVRSGRAWPLHAGLRGSLAATTIVGSSTLDDGVSTLDDRLAARLAASAELSGALSSQLLPYEDPYGQADSAALAYDYESAPLAAAAAALGLPFGALVHVGDDRPTPRPAADLLATAELAAAALLDVTAGS